MEYYLDSINGHDSKIGTSDAFSWCKVSCCYSVASFPCLCWCAESIKKKIALFAGIKGKVRKVEYLKIHFERHFLFHPLHITIAWSK